MEAFYKITVKISVSDFILFRALRATQIALSLHKNDMLGIHQIVFYCYLELRLVYLLV